MTERENDETIHCGEIGCGEEFEVSQKQFETGHVKCPKCGVEQEVILG